MKTSVLATSLVTLAIAAAQAGAVQVDHKFETVDGLKVFYREAGPKSAKTIVLLHGFPSSSHMFRDLIPKLATRYHVIAPDYIGFGYSDAPSPKTFTYNFDRLASITNKFLEQKNLGKYSLYLQDYGGPVGLRIAAANPERVEGLVIQNSNAYVEGISEAAKGILVGFGSNRNAETEKAVAGLFSPEGIKYQYVTGTDASKMSPDGYTFDSALFNAKPENTAAQLDLVADYKNNVALYDSWHAYFRKWQPKALVVWGTGDPFFTVDGAKAFQKDLKDVELHLLEAGHFALEEKADFIAEKILAFLGRLK